MKENCIPYYNQLCYSIRNEIAQSKRYVKEG